MTKVRITGAYKKFSNTDLLAKFRFIISSVDGNANFLSPTPSIASLISVADEYERLITKARAGARYDMVVVKAWRKEVIKNMERLSSYILMVAKNNAAVVESSGFTVAKRRSTPDPLQKPTGLRLVDGVNTGELKLLFKRVANAKSYLYQIAEGPLTNDTQWTSIYGTRSKATFTKLKSGVKYWVRVAAVGTKNQLVYSDAVSRSVQ